MKKAKPHKFSKATIEELVQFVATHPIEGISSVDKLHNILTGMHKQFKSRKAWGNAIADQLERESEERIDACECGARTGPHNPSCLIRICDECPECVAEEGKLGESLREFEHSYEQYVVADIKHYADKIENL